VEFELCREADCLRGGESHPWASRHKRRPTSVATLVPFGFILLCPRSGLQPPVQVRKAPSRPEGNLAAGT
jgi:hypothetical protein